MLHNLPNHSLTPLLTNDDITSYADVVRSLLFFLFGTVLARHATLFFPFVSSDFFFLFLAHQKSLHIDLSSVCSD